MSNLEYYWAEPDAEIVEQHLIGLADALDDIEEPMAAAAFITAEDIQQRFKTGTAPDGIPWKKWSDNYEPFALAHSMGPILAGRANLHLTGDLEAGVTDPSVYLPTDEGLFLDTSDLPEYWAWNNFGAERTAGAGGESAAETRAANIKFRASGRVMRSAKLPGDNPLPERPFIGLSEKAKAKITAAFEAWLVEEVAIAESSTGRPYFQHRKRGAGGRFVKK